ncbi:universal stress protein [Mycobacterium lacus]|uniref:Universal stress protein n=1 Tax=Mycobacterium lacus TaxID=169765 RepID=A0A7I7NK71_9MYCO|nr:universal stress protein [Mycobacterium lacus]
MGIDGSDAAINAAKWAVAEAASRDIPMRLIHAIPEPQPGAPEGDAGLDLEFAETALRTAAAEVHAMGQPIKVEAEVVRGPSDRALIDESRNAEMVCVGSVGIGWVARKVLGSTADAVARQAHCPVAIIRTTRDGSPVGSDSGWIAVVVDDSAGNDAVLEHGFREAQLRGTPILALGAWRWGVGEIPYRQLNRRLGPWVSRYPDVHVRPAAARRGVAEFLAGTEEPIQLAVVGSGAAGDVARMIGPATPHVRRHAGCSVLVVRG